MQLAIDLSLTPAMGPLDNTISGNGKYTWLSKRRIGDNSMGFAAKGGMIDEPHSKRQTVYRDCLESTYMPQEQFIIAA